MRSEIRGSRILKTKDKDDPYAFKYENMYYSVHNNFKMYNTDNRIYQLYIYIYENYILKYEQEPSMLLAYIEKVYFECYRFKCFDESMKQAIRDRKPFEWEITLPKFITKKYESEIEDKKTSYKNYKFYNKSAVQEPIPKSKLLFY